MHLQLSVVPQNLNRNLEATIESQKYEIQILPRDLQTTLHFNSIQVVCVDESAATSTSSLSRITEPAISHVPQAGSDHELFLQREIHCRKQLQNWQRESRQLQWQYTMLLFRRLLYQLKVQKLTVAVPDYGGPEKRETESVAIDNWLQLTQFRSWTNSLQKRSLTFLEVSQRRFAMDL